MWRELLQSLGDDRARARTIAASLEPEGELRLILAQICLGLGDFERALQLLESAPTLRFHYRALLGRFHEALESLAPTSAAFDAEVADVLMRRDNPQAALKYLDHAISLQPEAEALHLARADALIELGQWEAASAAIAQGAPGNLAVAAQMALRAGAFQYAEELARKAADTDVLGHLALFRGDYHSALAQDPLIRGAALSLLGDDAAAENVLAPLSDNWEARVWLGEIRLRRGDYAAAIDLFQSAAEMAPGLLVCAHMLRLLAAIRSRGGDQPVGGFAAYGEFADFLLTLFPDADLRSDEPQEIAALLERALTMLKGNRTLTPSIVRDGALVPVRFRPGPRFAARRLMNLIATSPEEDVLADFETLISQYPDSGLPRCYRAELNLWLGHYSDARKDLEYVVSTFPDTRWAYIGLGTVEMLGGEYQRALDIIARGIARKHNTMGPPAYAVRGEILRRMGRLAEAVVDLEKACELTPRRASAWINLSLAYSAIGRAEEAARIFEFISKNAAPFIYDVSEGSLDQALMLMQGNRSSSGITWKLPNRPLRFIFFEGRESNQGLQEIQTREQEIAKASLRRISR